VADGHHRSARLLQRGGDRPRRLALPDAGPDGRDGHDRDRRLQHRRVGAEQHEVRAGREHLARLVHDVLVRDVGVREHDVVDPQVGDEPREL
jgi:hypothetical protein